MDTHRHHPPLNPRQVSHGDSPSVPRGRSPLPTHCWRKTQTATHQTRGRLEERTALLLRFLSCPLGRRPTVGPQTLDLLIGVRIPASQLDLPKSGYFVATLPPLPASSSNSAFSASRNFASAWPSTNLKYNIVV